tara:strand:+ start:7289 stop:10936 length:3648 start_codon:yes stop_codon:yes gene_type:complete
MDAIEKNIKNTNDVVRYSKNVDIRQVADSLQVKVYATGLALGKKYNKSQFITMDYDVSMPVQLYEVYSGKDILEAFLYFKKENFKLGEFKPNKTPFLSDFIIRLNIENNRTLSLKQVGSKREKSLLTTKEFYLVGKESALNKFSRPKQGKTNKIEMVLPAITENKEYFKPYLNLGFDVDLRVFSTTGPVTSIFFKLNTPKPQSNIVKKYFKDKTGDVDKVILVEPRRIKTLSTAPTSYKVMDSKDLELGQFKFNYFDYFQKLNQEYTDYYIKSSEVYVVKNNENYNLNMGNFLKNSTKEIPYNVSRKLDGNTIKPTSPYFEKGLKKYPLNWVSELRNNEYFSKLNRCIELTFYCEEHLDSFDQSLKENQIANLETYSTQDGTSSKKGLKPRTYNGISEWINRTDNDYFNDLRLQYSPGGKLKSMVICPSKETKVDEYTKKHIWGGNKCKCKYSNGSDQKLTTILLNSTDGDCADVCRKTQNINNFSKCWTCEKTYYSPIKDLRNDFFGTTFSTMKESFSAATQYTGYTSGGLTGKNTYDIYFSGNGYTATTSTVTGVAIPINNVNRIEHRPFIGVNSPSWVPYNSWQSLSAQTGTSVSLSGAGALIVQSGDPINYMIYKSLSGGTYKFQYSAYLDVKYTDTKWCEYVSSNYLSGDTSSIGYPATEYELKRLINSSIIEKGLTEGETVKQDTDGIYFPGKNGLNNNTGILDFNFEVFLEKETISGVTNNMVSAVVGTSPLTTPSANLFLLNSTNNVQNSMSGFSNCYSSGASANTVFHSQIPIKLDTGLITLTSGETMMLKYNTQFEATSKVAGGIANIEINLGHKLDLSGTATHSPFYRVTKYSPPTGSTSNLKKKLFMNPQKKSSPEKYVNNKNETIEQISKGSLYIIDDKYSPISTPVVNSQTFQNLTFIDNSKSDTTLNLNVESNVPTNNWAKQIQNNSLVDYYLPNQKELIEMKSGILIFNLPRYDQKESTLCNYKFPQISQSYVIKNTISNVKGAQKDHFIVVTPSECLYTPCFTPTLEEKVELIDSEIKIKEKVDNVDNQIIIDGQPIILKNTRSEPLTQLKSNEGFRCKFYCVCEDKKATIPIHPFYGTTDVITDTAILDCDDCEERAESYCAGVNRTCTSKVFSNSCIEDKSNLYTSGDEYLLPNGDVYVGFYHMHDGEPMVGAVHTKEYHETLTQTRRDVDITINKLNNIAVVGVNYGNNNRTNGY